MLFEDWCDDDWDLRLPDVEGWDRYRADPLLLAKSGFGCHMYNSCHSMTIRHVHNMNQCGNRSHMPRLLINNLSHIPQFRTH